MVGISGIKAPYAAAGSLRSRRTPPPDGTSRPPPCQDVSVVAPPPPAERVFTRAQRPSAAFLAHLLATDAHAPQTRTRRRAAPLDAQAAYLAVVERPLPAGLLVRASA